MQRVDELGDERAAYGMLTLAFQAETGAQLIGIAHSVPIATCALARLPSPLQRPFPTTLSSTSSTRPLPATDNQQLSVASRRLLDARVFSQWTRDMIHTILISGHAAAGIAALIAGCLAIRHDRAMSPYLASVMALLAFLVAAVALDWSSQATGLRLTFAALTLLAAYVLYRATQAASTRRPGAGQQSPQFLDHLGFTLIALLVGFVAIAILDLGAPTWVVAAGLVCIAVGHTALQRMKALETKRPPSPKNDPGSRNLSHSSAMP